MDVFTFTGILPPRLRTSKHIEVITYHSCQYNYQYFKKNGAKYHTRQYNYRNVMRYTISQRKSQKKGKKEEEKKEI